VDHDRPPANPSPSHGVSRRSPTSPSAHSAPALQLGAAPVASTGSVVSTGSVGLIVQETYASLSAVTDSPRLEAEILLSHVLGISRTGLLAHPERALTRVQQARYGELVQRRAAGWPLPYLIGRVEFYGLEFEVTPEVLIPRPETETLVELALSRRPARPLATVMDVGAGSGCIAVSLAVHLPDALILAVDISPAVLAVARRNAQRHGVGGRIRFLAGDLLTMCPGLSGLPDARGVDLVISNPPYVSAEEWASLPTSVRVHEPRLALDGGPDGLDVVRRLLVQAPAALGPGGALLVEIGAGQGQAALDLAQAALPEATARIHRDLAGRDRVLEVQS
jgi:release factor glutamine methyltransferase